MHAATFCPCGSGNSYEQCCGLCHGGAHASSAQALMRSRYSAYVHGEIDYLVATTLPYQQAALDVEAIRAWSASSTWLGLEIDDYQVLGGVPEHALVTFTARWHDAQGEHRHQERSAFVQAEGRWYFIDPTVRQDLGRNDTCPCGSLRKVKKCCGPYLA